MSRKGVSLIAFRLFWYWFCLSTFKCDMILGFGHVQQNLAELHISIKIPLDTSFIRNAGICIRIHVRTMSWRHCCHLFQYAEVSTVSVVETTHLLLPRYLVWCPTLQTIWSYITNNKNYLIEILKRSILLSTSFFFYCNKKIHDPKFRIL